MRSILAIFVLSVFPLCIPTPLPAAEKEKSPIVASSYDQTSSAQELQPFRLIILGTRSGPDIDLIRKNMEKVAYISLFVPTSVSQKHIEFSGRFSGDTGTLIADIESLSQDRYEVKSRQDNKRGLVITLRKIQPVATTAEP